MAGLQYVGRAPDGDYSTLPKRYADQRYDTVRVDADYIQSQVSEVASTLVNQAYVDNQDSLRATQVAVDVADSGYLLATRRGQANGVAPIASDGYIPAANLPTVQTNRKPTIGVLTANPFQGTVRTVSTTSVKEYLAASLTIADPGYPYYPLVYGMVRGGPVNATQNPPRNQGTPNYGQITILDDDNVKYAWCICGSRKVYDYHMLVPFADTTVNPTTRPPVYGALTLHMYFALWGGNTFTFDGNSPWTFGSINYPAV